MPNSKKSAQTQKEVYGENHFAMIGSIGGSAPTKKLKGWAWMKVNDPERYAQLQKKSNRKT